jgi:EAL domain-containing protein (putative c-di-GMP-specific phosphodiesterase class I)
VSASIGVVTLHAESGDQAAVLAAADMACYAAKEAGRNRIHVYRASDAELRQRHGEMLWVARLNEALAHDRFLLYRQSIVPTRGNGEGELCEVLLRLRAGDDTLVTPAEFLSAAERYNMMPAIDRWVIRTLFTRHGEHLRAAVRPGCAHAARVSINLSGATLSDDTFLDFVRGELHAHAIPPERVCFEITETAAIANLGRAVTLIEALRALGCRFALDDFGSGLSSFGYLKNLPVDYLKIDGTLVRHIADNPIDYAMVEAINGIGHVMGIRTIAEFVENDAIRERLTRIGVDYLQGYGIDRPAPLA